jgi:hypothetical protein
MGPRTHIGGVAIVAFCAGIAISFFTIPLWVTFAINVAKEGGRTDWLGFAGSIVGAAMTLVAAAIAWLAVQKQIGIQQKISDQQTAIQQFTILQSALGVVQEEDRLNALIRLEAQYSKIVEDTLGNSPLLSGHITATKQYLEGRIKEIEALADEFDRAGKNRWAFPGSGDERHGVRGALIGLNMANVRALQILAPIDLKLLSSGILTAQDIAQAKAISLATARDQLIAECATFQTLLARETTRLSNVLNESRRRAAL